MHCIPAFHHSKASSHCHTDAFAVSLCASERYRRFHVLPKSSVFAQRSSMAPSRTRVEGIGRNRLHATHQADAACTSLFDHRISDLHINLLITFS